MSLPRRFFFKVSLNICLELILVFMLLDAEIIKTSNTSNLTFCIHFVCKVSEKPKTSSQRFLKSALFPKMFPETVHQRTLVFSENRNTKTIANKLANSCILKPGRHLGSHL